MAIHQVLGAPPRTLVVAFVITALAVPARGDDSGIAAQLADERAVLTKTIATIDDKIAALELERTNHVRAVHRALAATQRFSDSALASARRRAAARYVLARDLDERTLLTDERVAVEAAAADNARATVALPTMTTPRDLVRPARGKIARKFGTLVHDRSTTTLARRGIDIEVDSRAPAVAAAPGTVRYAGPIRGLDSGIIIDHGGYYTVVGKLGETTVPVGAKVASGDRIGRAARQRVYFEVRIKIGAGGRPIDPLPLLAGATL